MSTADFGELSRAAFTGICYVSFWEVALDAAGRGVRVANIVSSAALDTSSFMVYQGFATNSNFVLTELYL